MSIPRVTAEPLSDHAVRLTCQIKRPPEKVFDAWLKPGQIVKWFVCDTGAVCNVLECDPRVGGSYRFSIECGGTCVSYGTYQVVDRPHRLVFTWLCENSDFEKGETLVTVDFIAFEDGTKLILTHERLSGKTSREEHTEGWTSCLKGLAAYEETV